MQAAVGLVCIQHCPSRTAQVAGRLAFLSSCVSFSSLTLGTPQSPAWGCHSCTSCSETPSIRDTDVLYFLFQRRMRPHLRASALPCNPPSSSYYSHEFQVEMFRCMQALSARCCLAILVVWNSTCVERECELVCIVLEVCMWLIGLSSDTCPLSSLWSSISLLMAGLQLQASAMIVPWPNSWLRMILQIRNWYVIFARILSMSIGWALDDPL